jgi:hypothetical protein
MNSVLDFSLVYEILSHRSLVLSSEDSLFEFTRNVPHYFELLEFVRFEFLSIDAIYQFVDDLLARKSLSQSLNQIIWANICHPLVLDVPG